MNAARQAKAVRGKSGVSYQGSKTARTGGLTKHILKDEAGIITIRPRVIDDLFVQY
jgi:hypothetical protein